MLHAHVVNFLVHSRHLFAIPFFFPSQPSSFILFFPRNSTPRIRPPPRWVFSNVFYYVAFIIHHTPPQSKYIHAHPSVHVLYSCRYATPPLRSLAVQDLDLGFSCDAGGDEPRGSAESSSSDM